MAVAVMQMADMKVCAAIVAGVVRLQSLSLPNMISIYGAAGKVRRRAGSAPCG